MPSGIESTAPRLQRFAEVGALAADLRLVIGRLARRLRQRGETDVSASLLSAMWTIERLQPVTPGDVAAAEGVQPPTVTRIVARLEDLGLIAREGHPRDRRSSHVRLTAAGQRLLDRTRKLRTAYLARQLRDLDEDDRAVLRRAAEILRGFLEDEP